MKVRTLIVFLFASLASAPAAPEGPQYPGFPNTPGNTLRERAAFAANIRPQGTEASLELGNSVESVLSKGAREGYRILLSSQQYLRLSITVHGIGVTATLLSPADTVVVKLKFGSRQSATPIHFISHESGTYRLEILADEGTPTGRYRLKVDELRRATEGDTRLVRAQALLRQGEELRWKGTADSLHQAIQSYKQALDLYKAAGDPRGQAETLLRMGLVYRFLRDFPSALDHDQQALEQWRSLGDKDGEAQALYYTGYVYFQMGDRQKALRYHSDGLALARSVEDLSAQSEALNGLGLAYRYLGNPQKALECYNESLRLARLLGEQDGAATLLGNIAVLYGYLGDTQKALETFNQALAAPRTGDGRASRAQIMDNIGKLYNVMGEKQKALEYLNDSLRISQELGDADAQANSLNSIALVHASLGDNDKALELLNSSRSLARSANDRPAESTLLYNIGRVYLDSGDDEKALQFFNEALRLNREMNNPEGIGQTLQQIGRVHAHRKEWQEAVGSYNQAVSVLRSAGSPRKEAAVLSDLGAAYASSDRVDDALQVFTAARSLSRTVMEPEREASALAGLARLELRRGRLVESRGYAEAALQIAENIRSKVSGLELRVSYFAAAQDYFRLYTEVLAQLHRTDPHAGYDVQAFEASERMRARALLDLLNEAGINVREGVDPKLLDRERQLEQLVQAKSEYQVRLLSGKHTEEQAEAVRKELDALLGQFQEVESQIRATSPRYGALTQPRPLTAREIQTDVLDSDTTLLEFALGEETSYAWAVTQGSIALVQLPRRAEIEAAAKDFYELQASNSPADRTLAATRALSQLLLTPLASHLAAKRLAIVADGALQYLPFGALLQPETVKGGESTTPRNTLHRPLIADHEIVSLPSASTLAVLRREIKDRNPAAKAVAVLADPVFTGDDPRVMRGQEKPEESIDQQIKVPIHTGSLNADLERSGKESGVLRFDRLLSTRKEAEEILTLARDGQVLKALDFRANRVTATNEELGGYRIVHFASHALLNVRHPELSGVVLSLVDEQGRPQDGFLRLQDIYNLKLRADLVVLSACETALGANVKGEGLVGLTRGFMYAGAPRVVASLWRVPDKATAELMKQFYKGMLVDGLRPAAALRTAQISMTKERRWADPYYWAAFILQGEWQ